jgi:hypothetical protein
MVVCGVLSESVSDGLPRALTRSSVPYDWRCYEPRASQAAERSRWCGVACGCNHPGGAKPSKLAGVLSVENAQMKNETDPRSDEDHIW